LISVFVAAGDPEGLERLLGPPHATDVTGLVTQMCYTSTHAVAALVAAHVICMHAFRNIEAI